MNTLQVGVIALLKSAITQHASSLPADFDPEEAFPAVKHHHMAPLLYEGALVCGLSPNLPSMQSLFKHYCQAMLVNQRQMLWYDRLCRAFQENGIDYMPLKGCNMKALYPKPEIRTMGDADVLIRMEQYDKIVPIMESLGFEAGVESDHELQWIRKELFLELHKRLIPSYNRDMYSYFGDGWRFAVAVDGTRYAMSPEDEMVYLFTHFAKHYRDGGIGCRHIVDLWVYLRAHPDLQENKIRTALEQLGLWEFYGHIRRLLDAWFCQGTCDEKTDFITDFIFSSGSWGDEESHEASAGLRDSANATGKHRAQWVYILRLTFPKLDYMKTQYPVLEKAPWLLLALWLWRPIHKLCSRGIGQKLRYHRQKLMQRSANHIQNRRQALKFVDLDPDF